MLPIPEFAKPMLFGTFGVGGVDAGVDEAAGKVDPELTGRLRPAIGRSKRLVDTLFRWSAWPARLTVAETSCWDSPR